MIAAAIDVLIDRRALAGRAVPGPGQRGPVGQGSRLRPRLIAMLAPALLGGCSMHAHSPTLSISGSYFPVWLIAALLGVIFSVVLRLLFIRFGLHEHLPVPPLTYFCAAIFSGIMIWILWTGGMAA